MRMEGQDKLTLAEGMLLDENVISCVPRGFKVSKKGLLAFDSKESCKFTATFWWGSLAFWRLLILIYGVRSTEYVLYPIFRRRMGDEYPRTLPDTRDSS